MILSDIADAFNAVGVEVYPHFGNELKLEEIEAELPRENKDAVIRILYIESLDPNGNFSESSQGCIEEGDIWMWVIGRRDKTVVTEFESWMGLLYTSPIGGKNPPLGVVSLGGVDFYAWRPSVALAASAEKWGDLWVVPQLVRFAAIKL